MYNNKELTINYENDYLNGFADLQSVINASIAQNYQSEIQLIDNDESLSTKEKIRLRRSSLLFFFLAIGILSSTPQICKYLEHRISA